MRGQASFDWILSDMHLVLADASGSSEKIIARSAPNLADRFPGLMSEHHADLKDDVVFRQKQSVLVGRHGRAVRVVDVAGPHTESGQVFAVHLRRDGDAGQGVRARERGGAAAGAAARRLSGLNRCLPPCIVHVLLQRCFQPRSAKN
eukprot:2981924-Rhodomonas_salina.2